MISKLSVSPGKADFFGKSQGRGEKEDAPLSSLRTPPSPPKLSALLIVHRCLQPQGWATAARETPASRMATPVAA